VVFELVNRRPDNATALSAGIHDHGVWLRKQRIPRRRLIDAGIAGIGLLLAFMT